MTNHAQTNHNQTAQQHYDHLRKAGHPFRLIAWLTGLKPDRLRQIARKQPVAPHIAEKLLALPETAYHNWAPRSQVTDVLVELRAAKVPHRWYCNWMGWETEPKLPPYVPVTLVERAYQLYRMWITGELTWCEVDGQMHRVRSFEGERGAHPYVRLAEILEERMERDWRADAECVRRQVPPSQFFADDLVPGSRETMLRTASEVCAVCRVADRCLRGLADLEIGVVGNLTVTQRQQLAG